MGKFFAQTSHCRLAVSFTIVLRRTVKPRRSTEELAAPRGVENPHIRLIASVIAHRVVYGNSLLQSNKPLRYNTTFRKNGHWAWGNGQWEWGMGNGEWGKRKSPMPYAQCPMPNAQCPITNYPLIDRLIIRL
ncbi:hypothetical protein PI95_022700 [Hassallia byssoidea VB512170]|uniref:Uncharacterized protein n=1 Tax=Hassallia byssoidea VB512170 TaxID=1304833 RepID=A0A846HFU2_9CYAN|nr:hypothetical protein [Hassalia byssoidea]NEU75291.1 hypothetical protein [Hassalia byssoidea VB512170]